MFSGLTLNLYLNYKQKAGAHTTVLLFLQLPATVLIMIRTAAISNASIYRPSLRNGSSVHRLALMRHQRYTGDTLYLIQLF